MKRFSKGTESFSHYYVGSKKANKSERDTVLPVIDRKDEIIKSVRSNSSLVIISETGSGKTTQIPKMICKNICNQTPRRVVCTQPRRVAAISIAQKVSFDVDCRVGETVGYMVRYEDMTSSKTRLVFATDGSLLRESIQDPLLTQYSCVICDEAHERSLHTDIIFGVIKNAQRQRSLKNIPNLEPLKIVIMSATIDADKYAEYFNANVLYIEGRQYKIDVFYLKKNPSDYFNTALTAVFQLHKDIDIKFGILLFLTGEEEIENMRRIITEIKKCQRDMIPDLEVIPLYSALPSSVQMKAFEQPQKTRRKIVLSTNIAETSVTIPGIFYVIDSGVVKVKSFIHNMNMEILRVEPVSRTQARQRMGRAGRLGNGFCFRLYTEHFFYNQMEEDSTPEILRCNLSNTILQLSAMGIDNIQCFDWFTKPCRIDIKTCFENLILWGALDSNHKITKIGNEMVRYPIDPIYSRVIVESTKNDCLTDEIITLVALLSEESLFSGLQGDLDEEKKLSSNSNNGPSFEKTDLQRKRRLMFFSEDGDHVMLLQLWKSLQAHINRQDSNVEITKWCREHNVNVSSITQAMKSRKQMIKILLSLNKKLVNGNRFTQYEISTRVRRLFLSGFLINCALLQPDGVIILMIAEEIGVKIGAQICPTSSKNLRIPCADFVLVDYFDKLCEHHFYR